VAVLGAEGLIPRCAIVAAVRLRPWRGIGTPRGRASSPAGQRGAFLSMQEGTMTAHRKARKAVAKKPTSAPVLRHASKPARRHPKRGWPAVVRYALEDWPRTARLGLLVVVAGVVLGVVLAELIILRLLI
jgi:hypothetical protein